MSSVIDTYLGVHPQALKLSAQRNELLASNLANADTPNFKAKDIDFKAAMAATGGASGIGGTTLAMTGSTQGTTRAGHIALSTMADSGRATEQYRVPLAPSLDGNTVDAQMEQANFAQNTVRYQATLTMLNAKFRSLMTAITGQ